MLLPFFRISCGVDVLNSAIFNSFHNRVKFGTILEGLRNLGGVWNPQPPSRYATAAGWSWPLYCPDIHPCDYFHATQQYSFICSGGPQHIAYLARQMYTGTTNTDTDVRRLTAQNFLVLLRWWRQSCLCAHHKDVWRRGRIAHPHPSVRHWMEVCGQLHGTAAFPLGTEPPVLT